LSLGPHHSRTNCPWPWAHVAVGILAFGVRLAHVLFLEKSDPMFAHPAMDARWHVEWARALALGIAEGGPFFRAPLYPYFLSGLFKLFGMSFLIPRIVQVVIGTSGCLLTQELGKRLGGRGVGVVAGLTAALYGPLIYFDGEFLVETLFLPLIAASLLLTLHARESSMARRPAVHWWVLAGFVTGLATIARPNMLIVAIGMIAWIFWELAPGRRARAITAWLALFALPVGAVTAYNASEGGGFVLVASQGGVNFWIGNNRIADGKSAIFPPYHGPATKARSRYRDSVEFNARLEAERRLGQELRDADVSSYWFGQGVRFIRDEPGVWIRLTLEKAYFLVNGYELPSNREVYRVRRWSPVLATLLWERPLAFPFGLIFPLALAGILIASSAAANIHRPLHRLLLLYLCIYGVGVIAFFVTARHRVPIVPTLIVYASLALASAPSAFRSMLNRKHVRPARAIALFLMFAGGVALSNTEYFEVRKYHRGEHCLNLGYAYAQQRRYEEALTEYQFAIAEEPRFVRAHFNAGAVYAAQGRPDEARQALMTALEIDPKYVDAWVELGRVNSEGGNFKEAEETFRKALELNPKHTLAHYGLALLYLKAWDFAGYKRHLALAHQADPDFAPANLAIAELLVEQGRPNEAREYLKRAARVDPQSPRLKKLAASLGN